MEIGCLTVYLGQFQFGVIGRETWKECIETVITGANNLVLQPPQKMVCETIYMLSAKRQRYHYHAILESRSFHHNLSIAVDLVTNEQYSYVCKGTMLVVVLRVPMGAMSRSTFLSIANEIFLYILEQSRGYNMVV